MFKRNKVDTTPVDETPIGEEPVGEKPSASGVFSAGEKNPPGHEAAKTDDLHPTPSRTLPAYETRKSAVRTFSSSHASSLIESTPANLHVGRGLKLEGKIQSCDTLVIEGCVQATIESETLTISETGEVTGEATVGNAEITGKFDGMLIVRECLTVHATGQITGTVHYGELKVEQGGKISGQIESRKDSSQPLKAEPEAEMPIALKDAASA